MDNKYKLTNSDTLCIIIHYVSLAKSQQIFVYHIIASVWGLYSSNGGSVVNGMLTKDARMINGGEQKSHHL